MTSKGYWRGRPIEELPRADLEDALIELGALYSESLKQHSKDLQMLLSLQQPMRRKSLWQRLLGL